MLGAIPLSDKLICLTRKELLNGMLGKCLDDRKPLCWAGHMGARCCVNNAPRRMGEEGADLYFLKIIK